MESAATRSTHGSNGRGPSILAADEAQLRNVTVARLSHATVTALKEALRSEGLAVLEQTEREPYPEAEHPSRRCYVLARAV